MHTSPSSKVYIGITSQEPLKRWGNGIHYRMNKYFYKAIQKYGWENFKHEILFDNLTEKEAKQNEIELIATHKSNNRKFGYNLTKGGDGIKGYAHTEKTKTKISLSNMGVKKPHAGVLRSVECRKKIAESHCKPVLQFAKDGSFIKEFSSIEEASLQTGAGKSNISSCCLGKRKTAKKFIWKFKNI
jgi:group I intron endonuclease